mmetsp:Transcript_26429/g.30436  ORF Transcript_26429/g.30436 Transcript_26429/m.30436 type:complete len:264 (-) Transcript_26429:352-1143(-)
MKLQKMLNMSNFNLLVLLFSLNLCSTTCEATVSCGGHSAATCAECPMGNGAAWCNGDCAWDFAIGQCTGQSVQRGNGSTANKCAECPSETTGCSSTDCSWHPHTNLCRDAFSDEIRTASVHLNYDKPSVTVLAEPAWWFQRVIPTASADATYFATNGHRFGYGGIQQVNANIGRVLFSLWDQGGCDQDVDPNCNEENLATTIACGTGVTCTGFGGEGTGRKSMLDLGGGVFPQVDQEYFFVTQAAYLSNRLMEYTEYFYLDRE